jgi:WD40 repeat protein
MTAVAIYAFSERANARTESSHARARALLAESLHQLEVDPQLSMLLGLEAAKTDRTGQTQDVLSQALETSRMRDVRGISNTAPLPAPPGDRLRIHGKALPRGAIRAVALSPNGRVVATGHGDDTLRLWSATTGRQLKVLRGHQGDVDAVAFSPDGKLLASGSTDGTGRLWTSAGDYLGPLVGHTGFVTAVAFNPRSDLVATASTDRTVRIWKISLGQLPVVLRGHRGAVTRVRFSRDGSRIFTVSRDGTERSWDPEPEPWMHVARDSGLRLRPKHGAGPPASARRSTVVR